MTNTYYYNQIMKHDIENANYCIVFDKNDNIPIYNLFKRDINTKWKIINTAHSKDEMKIIKDLYRLTKGFIHRGAIWGIYYYE